MDPNKFPKSVKVKTHTLKNGIDINYFELGEENSEVLVCAQFYFGSMETFLRKLAEKYHVYCVQMRFFEGPCAAIDWNGEENWAMQWADDLYDFTQEMGLTSFYYVGKCHGSNPGWGLLTRHPGQVKAFVAMSYLPIVEDPTNTVWIDSVKERIADNDKGWKWAHRFCRKASSAEEKYNEMQSINANSPLMKFAKIHTLFKDRDSIIDFSSKIDIPVMVMYGTRDPMYMDQMNSVRTMIDVIPKCKAVFFQGDTHFYEIDCPKKLAYEVLHFLEHCHDADE